MLLLIDVGNSNIVFGVYRDGRITGIRYAVPGRYAPEPPAGLEDYSWDDAGWCVLDIGVS